METEATKEKLIADFKALVADSEELLKATASQAGEKASAARQRIEQRLQEAKSTISEAEGILIDKTREMAKVADDYVRQNPWGAVGIATGIGLVLGLLLRRD